MSKPMKRSSAGWRKISCSALSLPRLFFSSGKKAQLTIFIILGLVLMIGGGVYLTTRETIISQAVKPFTEIQLQEIPTEFAPVQAFVQACLGETAKQGLKILGDRGGFIDLLRNNINARDDATNADAVPMSPGSSYAIPYWFYLRTPNPCAEDCEFVMVPGNKLTLKKAAGRASVEGQLEEYINENLKNCLNDFALLKQRGFQIEPKGAPNAEVEVYLDRLGMLLKYPLSVRKEGERLISEYLATLPIDLKKIFDTAAKLAEMEAEVKFFEKHALNVMVPYSGLDRNKLPPFHDTRPGFSSKVTWVKPDVKDRLKNFVLPPNIRLLQVYGTRNYEPIRFFNDPALDSVYNQGMLVPSRPEWSGYDITFDYNPFWNIYFEMDCDQECGPESVGDNLITGIILQQYEFVYDISFPVKVSIHDPGAFNGEGFTFTYFLEANIRQNEPMPSEYIREQAIAPEGSSQFCDADKKTSGEYKIKVIDTITDQPVDGVQAIIATDAENCQVGVTDDNGELATRMPVAIGATLAFSKSGYIAFSKVANPQLDKAEKLEIPLHPKLTKSFQIKKIVLEKNQDGDFWEPKKAGPLAADEEAMITMTRLGGTREGVYTTASSFKPGQPLPTVDIAPGKYEIRVDIHTSQNIRIPEKKYQAGDKQATIPELNTGDGFKIGGAVYNFTFTKYNLKKDPLVFYVLNPDIISIPEAKRTTDDLNKMTNAELDSNRYYSRLTQELW